jgi:hypothetical protein
MTMSSHAMTSSLCQGTSELETFPSLPTTDLTVSVPYVCVRLTVLGFGKRILPTDGDRHSQFTCFRKILEGLGEEGWDLARLRKAVAARFGEAYTMKVCEQLKAGDSPMPADRAWSNGPSERLQEGACAIPPAVTDGSLKARYAC